MKTWLITGCSSGIGRGIAAAALKRGDQVVLAARNLEKLREIAKEYPGKALAVKMDVTSKEDRKAALQAALNAFGGIDVLVNSAGYGYRSAVEEGEEEEIARLFAVNFFGPGALIKEVLPLMRKKKSGTIVNVTSMGGIRGAVGNGWYSAAKGALELLSDTLYKECGPIGIRVLTVEPGAFRTGFFDALHGTKQNIADYGETAGHMHLENAKNHHDQPGNPDKAGEVLVKLINRGQCPQRFALGSDSAREIRREYENRLAELAKWEALSRESDFD